MIILPVYFYTTPVSLYGVKLAAVFWQEQTHVTIFLDKVFNF